MHHLTVRYYRVSSVEGSISSAFARCHEHYCTQPRARVLRTSHARVLCSVSPRPAPCVAPMVPGRAVLPCIFGGGVCYALPPLLLLRAVTSVPQSVTPRALIVSAEPTTRSLRRNYGAWPCGASSVEESVTPSHLFCFCVICKP